MLKTMCCTLPWRNAYVTSCHGSKPTPDSSPGNAKSPRGQSAKWMTSQSYQICWAAKTATLRSRRTRVTGRMGRGSLPYLRITPQRDETGAVIPGYSQPPVPLLDELGDGESH